MQLLCAARLNFENRTEPYDLAGRHPQQRISSEEATKLHLRLGDGDTSGFLRHPGVNSFYAELTAEHPEIDTIPEESIDDHHYCPWSCKLDYFPMDTRIFGVAFLRHVRLLGTSYGQNSIALPHLCGADGSRLLQAGVKAGPIELACPSFAAIRVTLEADLKYKEGA